MSHYAEANGGLVEQQHSAATLEIDVQGRWDALALSELLISYHSFLVQHDSDRWVVHARAPGCHGESLAGALQTIDEWLAEHGRDVSSCRVGGRPYVLAEREPA